MLNCCNRFFSGLVRRVLSMRTDFYHRIEFGICPNCGRYRFLDYRRLTCGKERIKSLAGKEALHAYEKILEKLKHQKHGSKSNQNYHFGTFKKTKRLDKFGNPVYLQIRRNFNNEDEILGEVETNVTTFLVWWCWCGCKWVEETQNVLR